MNNTHHWILDFTSRRVPVAAFVMLVLSMINIGTALQQSVSFFWRLLQLCVQHKWKRFARI